jgi:predicted metalloprotease with PDZ domain
VLCLCAPSGARLTFGMTHALLFLLPLASLAAQDSLQSAPISTVHYEVTFNQVTARARSAHVTMSFEVTGAGAVILSLPAWTPGAYRITDFARNVTEFGATQEGNALRWDRFDHDTWRIYPGPAGRVRVSFRYVADSLDNAMSWSREDFLLFNGTNLFMYPEGQGFDWPATVAIHTEPDWLVGTAMPTVGEPGSKQYGERNFHDLVDHPFFVGRLEIDSAEVADRWFRLVTYPVGSLTGARRQRVWSAIQAMMPPQVTLFGDVPWQAYNLMQIADSAYQGASGLEHKDSHVNIVFAPAVDNPILYSLYAHELVHAWNVKRLRPAEMVPYAYDRIQTTRLLWVSEGITDYYADLVLLRGRVTSPDQFVQGTESKIRNVENLPEIAPEDASVATWVAPRDGTHYSYYDHGSVAGLLLDVLIRDATDNSRSLDDVMRGLYDATYSQGRGFTNDQFWETVERVAARPFDEFRARYIAGRERLPYADVLPLAGISVIADTVRRAVIGVATLHDSVGTVVVQVEPGSSAAEAGVQVGDVLLSVGEVEVTGEEFGSRFRQHYAQAAAGDPLVIRVARGGRELALRGRMQQAISVLYSLAIDPDADARTRRLREGIFRGVTD